MPDINEENIDKPVDDADLGAGDEPAPAAEAPKPDAAPAAPKAAAEEPAPKPEEDPAAAAAAPAPAAEPEQRDQQIPRARFDEVNSKLREEREAREQERQARERAEAELAELKAPKEPAVDIKALRKESREALYAGETEKAADLDERIDAEQRRLNAEESRRVADEAYTRAVNEMAKRESDRAYANAYAQTLTDHPFLDPKTGNPAAIAEALEWRDFYVAKGMPSHEALTKAAEKVAPAYAEKAEPNADPAGNVTPIDPRKAKAVARNIKDAGAQPAALVAGVGNRAVPTAPDPKTQEEWEKLPEAERAKLLA